MSQILIVFGSTEGQTHKIAHRVAEIAEARGHAAVVRNSAAHPPPVGHPYDAAVIAGSLHARRHQAELVRFARENREALRRIPTAFCSVSLTAALMDAAHQSQAGACAERFFRETGWRPDVTWLTAGALKYSRYGRVKKLLMRWIASRQGGGTDASRDYEYTDWERLEQQVTAFLQALETAAIVPAEIDGAAG
ncbi:MAG TPA: flavodoxin domain-containing protein [Longimicrobium sp.]|nr:flavodoxin domain-containing protein [Longimicrobium sp.]